MNKTTIKNRRLCFTIHNYTKKDLNRFHSLATSLEKHRYICYGLETAPETGTQHIQGYIELKAAQRFNYLQNYFDFSRNGERNKFHIEPAKGSAEENKKYVSKGGDFHEFGEPSFQGKRTDMIEIKSMVRDNPKQIEQIIDEHCDSPQQLQFAQKLHSIYLKPRDPDIPPKVFWISGKTGIGKTSLVYRTFKDVCSVSNYKWLGTDYNQNECFLMDDYRPGCTSFELLLKITDRYPTNLEFKGGFIALNSPFIVITSPDPIDKTFSYDNEDLAQLHRRIIEICLDNHDDIDKIDLRNLDPKYIYPPKGDDW